MRVRLFRLQTLALVTLVLASQGSMAASRGGLKPAPAPSPVAAYAQSPSPTPIQAILTFQAWKNLRIEEARLVLERMTYENQLEKMPVIERSPGEKEAVVRTVAPARAPQRGGRAESRIESRTEQARLNLEIAQDLTMNEYLAIYLSQFKTREAMLDIARRMPPEDVAELLMVNQKMASGGQVAEHSLIPSPRVSPKAL